MVLLSSPTTSANQLQANHLSTDATKVKSAVQLRLQEGLGALLDQVQSEVKILPEARSIGISRKDLIVYLDELLYEGVSEAQSL